MTPLEINIPAGVEWASINRFWEVILAPCSDDDQYILGVHTCKAHSLKLAAPPQSQAATAICTM